MARDGLISDGLKFFQGGELFAGVNLSGPKNKPKNPSNSYQEPRSYQPLARAASLISASINKAETETARALTRLARIEPTGQLEKVLQPLATLILGAGPDQKSGPELDIAQAVFEARRGFLTAEKAALRIAQSLPKEVPIRAIADGRMDIINEGIDLSFTPAGPFTPEDVVRIGMESLQDAGRKIQAALKLLESNVPTNEISPILRALAKAIDPSREPVIDKLEIFNKEGILKLNNEEKFLKNFDKKVILKLNDENYINQIPREVDPTTGLTAGSGNSTQDLRTLPEAVLLEIGYPDRNSRTSENITSD
jgi:hypothetical protein